MTPAEQIVFSERWFQLGCCPGCRGPLKRCAGQGVAHYRGGDVIWAHGRADRITESGEVVQAVSGLAPGDARLCRWSPDDLTSLVLMATGVVH